MSRFGSRIVAAAAAALVVGSASAQIFDQALYQLPADDFTWLWGDQRKREASPIPDLQTGGVEEDFRCDLTMRLAPRSRLDEIAMRDLANDLSTRLDFIYQSAVLMNQLERSFEIDWAVLVCKKGGEELDPDGRAEREAKARERALKAQQRRRERGNN